jgi:hypothetical protein
MLDRRVLPGSFRDPSGFLFLLDSVLYRQINQSYFPTYDQLISSGLYKALTEAGLLIRHEEASIGPTSDAAPCRFIRPERVPFISYPHEWCFSQLKDAALLTLQIQEHAVQHGMTLKDSSAYNVQFLNGRPVFIDTLSFERYEEGRPWVPYRQFCCHFLAPLALMSYSEVRLGRLFQVFLDGIPLDLTSRLLPYRTRLRPALLVHLHLHARSDRTVRARGAAVPRSGTTVSRTAHRGLIDSLTSGIRGLSWDPRGTEWADYYQDTNYTDAAMAHKEELVRRFIERVSPTTVWDLGANTGRFSRIAADSGAQTVAFDLDPAATERHYRSCKATGQQALLPLVLDLTNPTPGIGWAGQERMSLRERGPVDLIMTLALVHHLAISNNVPLERIAEFLASIGRAAIIEFVPKHDTQVQELLASRQDIFENYSETAFERAFAPFFHLADVAPIRESERTLYLMISRNR